VDEDGHSPLVLAVRLGRGKEVIKQLLRAGADINFPGHDGVTPLHYAAHEGDRAALEALTSSHELLPNSVDRYGSTALHYAIGRLGKVQSVAAQNQLLYGVEQLVKAKADLTIRDCRGRSCQDRIGVLAGSKQKQVAAAIKRGNAGAAAVKAPLPRACIGCSKQSLPRASFRYAEWVAKGDCRACVELAITGVEREEELLYVPTALKDIEGIIPSFEQQYISPLARKIFNQKMMVDADAGTAVGMQGLVDQILVNDDQLPFDDVVKLLRRHKARHLLFLFRFPHVFGSGRVGGGYWTAPALHRRQGGAAARAYESGWDQARVRRWLWAAYCRPCGERACGWRAWRWLRAAYS
jgi:hypothetical protein